MTTPTADWKQLIFQNLKARNRKETYEFADLIDSQNKLFEQVTALKSRNMQLTLETEKLKAENLSLQVRVDSGGPGGGVPNEKVQQLEQKLFKLHEELTEMHKKRGENAQQIIDLNAALKEKEKEILVKDGKLSDAHSTEQTLKNEMKNLERTILELEATNQTLKDEHQALQMAFTSLEEKHKKLMNDNDEIMARWLQQKMAQADALNRENDQFMAHKQRMLQKQLAEAALEPVTVTEQTSDIAGIPQICLNASIPTKAQQKLDAHEGEVNAVLWSPTGTMFATGGSDRKIKLWDFSLGQCQCKGFLAGSNAGITSLEYDIDEANILGASNDYACRLWSLSDLRLRHTLTGHSGKVLSAKFLGESSKVVSGSHDRTLKIWDLHTKAYRMSLLACTREDTLKVIDLRQNQVINTLCDENFKVASDWTRAVFSPDGTYVAAGSQDGTLFIWNIQKGKVEKTLKEHTHSILACSWHPAGSFILTSEKQKKVILWGDM
ncbi:autophagy-related protein 16-1-like isoform X2 [Dreissena polymorpha]|uniref:autophagy-related protein 16-1-like isoform X2 n=1 Tax=Dreissena polymorpha TaxID=45954 RepID=UPI002263B358|nr:autophagy-related protein 16-1-like isoform X2 [Dreissena polymorpha]